MRLLKCHCPFKVQWKAIYYEALSTVVSFLYVLFSITVLKRLPRRGTWVAQLIECLTLDVGSGCDPRVMRSSPTLGSVLSMEAA